MILAADALQWTLFFSNMLLLVGALRNMTLWRGEGALDMHHDYLLQADRPRKDRFRANYVIIIFWGLLEALALGSMINSVRIVPFSITHCDTFWYRSVTIAALCPATCPSLQVLRYSNGRLALPFGCQTPVYLLHCGSRVVAITMACELQG